MADTATPPALGRRAFAARLATLALGLGMGLGTAPATAAADPGETLLDAGTLGNTLLNNTLYRKGGPFWRRWQYAGRHAEDGTMAGRVWWNGGEERASGTWEVTADGLYCRTWSNTWGNGKRGCFRVSRAGDELIFDHVSGARGDADRYVALGPGNGRTSNWETERRGTRSRRVTSVSSKSQSRSARITS